jgi:hypothetical protein
MGGAAETISRVSPLEIPSDSTPSVAELGQKSTANWQRQHQTDIDGNLLQADVRLGVGDDVINTEPEVQPGDRAAACVGIERPWLPHLVACASWTA